MMTKHKQGEAGRETPEWKEQEGKGRPPGVQNKTTRLVKDAIILAAEEIGDITNLKPGELEGKDGLVGYLKHLARSEAKAFAVLLGKVLPTQFNHPSTTISVEDKAEEIREKLRKRGINIDTVYKH
jgi:hypothetical protein